MRRGFLMVVVLAALAFLACELQRRGEKTAEPSGAKPEAAAPAVPEAAKEAAPEPETVTTPSGLKYQELVVGNGPVPKRGSKVMVHYTGWLSDGTKFGSSIPRNDPLVFRLGRGEVIKGWDECVATMHVGGKRKLIVPPKLGYGDQGYDGLIPPNATLVYEVELLGFQ